MSKERRRLVGRNDVFVFSTLFIFVVGLVISVRPQLWPTAQERSLAKLADAVRSRRAVMLNAAEEHLRQFPDDIFGRALAAELAAMEYQQKRAIDLFDSLPRDGGPWELIAERGRARRFEIMGHLGTAERSWRRVLALMPQNVEANEHVGHLLQLQGRVWESAPFFFANIRRGACSGDDLLSVAVNDRFFRREERLDQPGEYLTSPDPVLRLAAARQMLFENRSGEAESLLREILKEHPELGEAQGRLGRLVVERGDLAEFLQWRGSLADEARDHPEVWFAQGIMAKRLGLLEGSVRCFLEVLDRSPSHLGANVHIASCLEQLGRSEIAAEFSHRAELLVDVEATLNLLRGDADYRLMTKVAIKCAELGRFWEAAGWCHVMTFMTISQEAPRQGLRDWLPLARSHSSLQARDWLPGRKLNREDFATPRWPSTNIPAASQTAVASATTAWSFSDDAAKVGINFQYFEGTTESNRLEHIFNVMGGGIGVLDYDLDGWPDLYLAQANNWRELKPTSMHRDQLYHNLYGERFDEVTEASGLGDPDFSHGVAVGDFDQDGFPDLYVGNKGPNRMYRNRGDGTFEDVTSVAGTAGNEWTTSSVFADFNGDGLPDLYVLNYTKLKETTERECQETMGRRKACTPDLLPAEDDRLYLNEGDGTFRDVSQEAGIFVPDGRGLGVVVWDFNGDGRLDLFVANDTTANFLFINQGMSSDGVPRFREEALVRGVAFDDDGHAQASMGVAASDANGNGRIDLFITNFFAESNTLYSQRADGFFDDLTRPLNLRDSSFWMLGFGCQFADLDSDGWEDLVVTNGHVDQRSSRGDPDRMSPQILKNNHGRRFEDVPSQQLGPFFQGRYLGRSLATLDWNRDGRIDFAVSHLQGPFALVTNRTPSTNKILALRLIGRTGCRDPIGALVRVRTAEKNLVRLRTAGDGFLTTNEDRLRFVLPAGTNSVQIDVEWPGGAKESWETKPGRQQEIVLIQGLSQPFNSLPAFTNP